ncbi:hypothetical protein DFH09DRAFT_1358843 [Mycena vulgaris]|nr:hypothetical protein DFH09DRAFT_1358843 [Mycena vulgaris]
MIRISTLVFLACVLASSSAVPIDAIPAARAISGSRSTGGSASGSLEGRLRTGNFTIFSDEPEPERRNDDFIIFSDAAEPLAG